MNKWDILEREIDEFDIHHDEQMAAFDQASSDALNEVKLEATGKLNEAKGFVDGLLSPESIAQTRE